MYEYKFAVQKSEVAWKARESSSFFAIPADLFSSASSPRSAVLVTPGSGRCGAGGFPPPPAPTTVPSRPTRETGPVRPLQARDAPTGARTEAGPPAKGRGVFERATLSRDGTRGRDGHVRDAQRRGPGEEGHIVRCRSRRLPVFRRMLQDLVARDDPAIH